MSPHPNTLALLAVATLAACGPNTGGVRGQTAFYATAVVTEIDADVPLSAFAGCFRDQATFLPLSKFEEGEDRFVYRLRAKDLWLEEMIVTPTPTGGITGELRVSGIYDDGWREILERDRMPALIACQTRAGLAEVAK
ncbi:MAG: hypothetical protein B7Z10_02860 [Rhodobacterales bacterium 32-66-7]|nr:MAG: hypothetical protein B7Z10_02860 [Rhodobacterales bacterium 32-66-7]